MSAWLVVVCYYNQVNNILFFVHVVYGWVSLSTPPNTTVVAHTKVVRAHAVRYSLLFVLANMAAAYLIRLIRSYYSRLVFVFAPNTNNYSCLFVTLDPAHDAITRM